MSTRVTPDKPVRHLIAQPVAGTGQKQIWFLLQLVGHDWDLNLRATDHPEFDASLELMAGGAGSSIGKGGMITKILAAKRAAGSGASTVIAWGREPEVLIRLTQGEAIGTLLVAQTPKKQARKQWMADHLQMRGFVTVDVGAVNKLVNEGKSLLPIGMTAVHGDFSRGDVIAIKDPYGLEIARGLANYSNFEARLLCGNASSELEKLLGYTGEAEMVHRTNLVLTR